MDGLVSKLNLLMSWLYWDGSSAELIEAEGNAIRLLIDSGAFTAWKSNRALRLDEYCTFLKDGLPILPWRYFALDIVGNPVGTRSNYDAMLDAGLSPIPIFTRGTDFDELGRYYETSNLVGLGGLVKTPRSRGYIRRFMQEVKGRDVHWLGFTLPSFVSYYKPYSFDSSNWDRTPRWGQLDLYAGRGRWLPYIRKARGKFNHKPSRAIMDVIQSYGIDPHDLAKDVSWEHSGLARVLSIWSWVRYAIDCEEYLDTKVFFATVGSEQLAVVIDVYHRELWRRNEQDSLRNIRRHGQRNASASGTVPG